MKMSAENLEADHQFRQYLSSRPFLAPGGGKMHETEVNWHENEVN